MPLPSLRNAERAAASCGVSGDPIYRMVRRVVEKLASHDATILDIGCGAGGLHHVVAPLFHRYIGCDVVEYPGFPKGAEFIKVDLETGNVPLPTGSVDVAIAVETIEHLESPRALLREMSRVVRPGGYVIVTTPNNLSFLSKLTFIVKGQFNAFQDSSYPAHITALLEIDLIRMAKENKLTEIRVEHTQFGRIPGTAVAFPTWLSKSFPRTFSDNVLMAAKRPAFP